MTKAQWYEKLVRAIPPWYLEEKALQDAHLWGVAAILEAHDSHIDDHVRATFLLQSEGEETTQHATERGISRLPGETDAQLAARTQSLRNTSNLVAITALLNSLVQRGVVRIVEDEYDGGCWVGRNSFTNRGNLIIDLIYNAFSIILEKQVFDSESFMDRESFLGREDFVGSLESPQQLFDLIVEAVNKTKAFGTVYRVVERS